MQCPTVQIQIEASKDNPSGIVTINESDYDPDTMKLVGAEPPVDPVPFVPAASGAAPVAAPPWGSKSK